MSKYTQKTLKALGEQGCITGMVERFIAQAGKAIPVDGNPHLRRRTGIRKDLFGIIDLIALRPINLPLQMNETQQLIFNREYTDELYNSPHKQGWELVGVQSFGQDFAEHKRKVLASKAAPIWLATGAAIELWGWRKLKVKRGGKAMVWTPRIHRLTKKDFDVIPTTATEEDFHGKSIVIESTPTGGSVFFDMWREKMTKELEKKFTVEDL